MVVDAHAKARQVTGIAEGGELLVAALVANLSVYNVAVVISGRKGVLCMSQQNLEIELSFLLAPKVR